MVIIGSIYGIADSLSNMSNPEKICLGLANAVKECSEHRMELGKELCSITETASAKCDPKGEIFTKFSQLLLNFAFKFNRNSRASNHHLTPCYCNARCWLLPDCWHYNGKIN